MDKNNKMKFDYHIHADVTDGTLKIEEIIAEAKRLGIKKIAITEHISKNPTYDWFEFKRKIKSIDTDLIILVGVEAKVLNENGDLNVNEDILKEADIVLGSLHGEGKVEWLLNSKCDIIAHPQLTEENVDKFINCGKVLEISAKYKLSYEILDKIINNNKFSFGSDAHKLEDLENGQKYFREINKKYSNIKWIN